MADYVPNMLRCAKCNFELERFTMNANTGAVGIGTNEPERCPNGCGPLWRVTWEQEARYLGKRMNEWADRAIAAEKRLAALGVGVDDTARLNMVLDTFGKREDNMPLTAAERGLIVAFTDRGSHTKGMKLSAIDDAVRAAEMEGENNG